MRIGHFAGLKNQSGARNHRFGAYLSEIARVRYSGAKACHRLELAAACLMSEEGELDASHWLALEKAELLVLQVSAGAVSDTGSKAEKSA